MTTFRRINRLEFCEAALAVFGESPPAFPGGQDRLFCSRCAPGEVVRFPGWDVDFVVLAREWELGPDHETVIVYVDVAPQERTLRSVS